MQSTLTNFDSAVTCDTNYYKYGALCYKDCAVIGMVSCGIGACSANSATCASSIITMALADISSAISIASLILTAGADAPITAEAGDAVRTGSAKISEEAL